VKWFYFCANGNRWNLWNSSQQVFISGFLLAVPISRPLFPLFTFAPLFGTPFSDPLFVSKRDPCCFCRRRPFGLAFFGLTFLSCCGRLIKINEVRWLFILLMEVSTITWMRARPPTTHQHPPPPTTPCRPWGAVNIYNFWLHFKSGNCAENQTGVAR